MGAANLFRPRAWGSALFLAALVALGVGLRARHLGWPPLWSDEAESALNALTILDQGVPVDHFLGLPLYENTLVRPWPESDEYEFRDLSYSDRGLAIYHGWLPLYAIAGAFRFAGVTPEQVRRGTPPADASTAELVRWTEVPRWPSVVFSGLFVFFCFHLARRMHSMQAGWAAGLGAAVSKALIWFGRQARYYSATLAASAACGLAIWNACRRGHFRDHALAGLALGILFHTHALSAVILAGVYAAALPLARGQERLLAKLALAGGVAGVLVLPWVWWSGFLRQSTYIPPARNMLDLPSLLYSLPARPVVILPAVLALAWFVLAPVVSARLAERWRRPFLDHAPAFYFAFAWIVLAYLAFVGLMPAASYFIQRLKLLIAVPGLLLISILLASAGRVLRPRSGVLAPVAMALLLALSSKGRWFFPGPESDRGEHEMARLVRSWRLDKDARVFATLNHHLMLMYYTGLPIQSVLPVRKSWLDRFDHDLVIVDGPWFVPIEPEEVVSVGREHGFAVTEAQGRARAADMEWLVMALDLETMGIDVRPPPRPLDALDRALVDFVREKTRLAMIEVSLGTPLRPAAALPNWREFWQFFFYWFSDPGKRLGPRVNYADRVRRGRTHILPTGWVVYDCRPRREPPLVPTADP